MGRRNDLMALACVVGGGLVAGGVTLALANGPALPSVECATTVDADAEVMVALSGEGVVMVRPDVRVQEVQVPSDGLPTLAVELGLSAHDAAYVWLARELDVELVSLDARLNASEQGP